MTVSPGYSGQTYIHQMTGKIREVRRMLDEAGSQAWLEVDGGLTVETLPEAVQAGATAIIAATAIFKHPGGIRAGIQALRDAEPMK
jgi:ribulose-phosphate 3-epimerase